MKTEPQKLTILITREGTLMVARCLEYDIVAQGKSNTNALVAWLDVYNGQMIVDERAGREPLEGIKPSPQRYFDLVNQEE